MNRLQIESQLMNAICEQYDFSFEKNQFELFRKALIDEIAHLLKQNTQKLQWILYRIDVNEKKLYEQLHDKYDEGIAECIADMIIQREVEKNKGSNIGNTDNWSFDIE